MSGDFAIRLENLSKTYRIPRRGRGTFRGAAAVALDALMGRSGVKHSMFHDFPALHPLDLTIGRGEAVAVIGRNGSGKSTLLQLIAKTLQPTTGSVRVNGTLSALLELGSGFNPEFTGIENIYLNGAIMGLSRERIDAKLDEILEFGDIGGFVEQPVRTYSSGMRMRLAFAVITAVDPEVLIVDEALSVGDAFFQSRCAQWLGEYVERGKTFLCVSHDMFMVQRLCRRGIVLNEGRVACDDTVAEAINTYYRLHWSGGSGGPAGKALPATTAVAARGDGGKLRCAEAGHNDWTPLELSTKHRTGDGRVKIERILTKPAIQGGFGAGEWIAVQVEIFARETVDVFDFGFGFRDRTGQLIGGYHSFYTDESFAIAAGERRKVTFRLKLDLVPQTYLLIAGIAINNSHNQWVDIDCLWDCASVTLYGPDTYWGLTTLPAGDIRYEPSASPAAVSSTISNHGT